MGYQLYKRSPTLFENGLIKLKLKHFCDSDLQHLAQLTTLTEPKKDAKEDLETFFKFVAFPLQTACSTLKKAGGTWVKQSIWDGHKGICLDDLMGNEPCLVYSFGIGNDLSFEVQMKELGITKMQV